MRAVIQRVSSAQVISDGKLTGKINSGLAILLGVRKGDTSEDAVALATKIAKLRIFSDENDKLNLSVADICGNAIVVSNFTLCANYAHGNRPDYFDAELPEKANELYKYIGYVGTGVFGAKMMYTINNDGPITIVMDSEVLLKKDIKK